MPRTWTDEQKQEASRKAKEQGLGRKAQVTTGPSAEALLIAQAQGAPAKVTTQPMSELVDAETMGEDKGNVSHTQPGKVRVYKPTPYGFKVKYIPSTNLTQALANGFKATCPDCGAECGDGVNDCPGRAKRAYRMCPVPQCQKKVYDYILDLDEVEDDDDEMKIEDDAYNLSTPELRTKAVLDKHMLALHPNEAAAAGIVAPAQRTLIGAK